MATFTVRFRDSDVTWEGEAASYARAVYEATSLDPDLDYHDVLYPDPAESGIPVVAGIDRKIKEAIEAGGQLDMSDWHGDEPVGDSATGCGTTHCRAGWAIHVAGEAGYALERRIDSVAIAARLIYAASRPGVAVPGFYADDDEAWEDICRCAEEQGA